MSRDHHYSSSVSASDAHNMRGIVLLERGWLDEALNEFQKAISLNPASPEPYDNMANVFVEKGDFLKALCAYVKAIEIDSINATSHYNLACFLANHAGELAVREYKETEMLEADFPDLHTNLGLTLLEQSEDKEAMKAFRMALHYNPDDTQARLEIGRLYAQEERLKDAAYEFRRILRQDPLHAEAHRELALAYAKRGFLKEALFHSQKALDLMPEDTEAKSLHASIAQSAPHPL